ncbi:MAG: hypothetical protein JXR76_04550 [Deltaproteobacteria bacterium]|nr:hypothetical protein [Deltaproteobacteria bacterium]
MTETDSSHEKVFSTTGPVTSGPDYTNIELPGYKSEQSSETFLLDSSNDGESKGLDVGDWIYITNPTIPTDDGYRGENATYLGNGKIYAHPFGILDVEQFSKKLENHASGLNLPERLTTDRIKKISTVEKTGRQKKRMSYTHEKE